MLLAGNGLRIDNLHACRREFFQQRVRLRLLEKFRDALRHLFADFIHGHQLRFRRLFQAIQTAEMLGQHFRGMLADLPDAKREQKTR